MSRFYGSLQGRSRIAVTRCGNTGISCHVRGWRSGVEVRGFIDDKGRDCFSIYRTGGSNDPSGTLVFTVRGNRK